MDNIVFILDACALARKFYNDIGKINLDTVFGIEEAVFIIPEIGIIETISALLAACNEKKITYNEYKLAVSSLFKMINDKQINVIKLKSDYVKDSIAILEKYKVQEGKSFNGIDSIYILLCNEIANQLNDFNRKVIFVTSDNKLYNASLDETNYNTFHFWTCDLGCGHTQLIPKKGMIDTPEKVINCSVCQNKIVVKEEKKSSNTCPICGAHCINCDYTSCVSTFIPSFI